MVRRFYRPHARPTAGDPPPSGRAPQRRQGPVHRHGGFSKDTRYEAERASIPLTLMDLDDLVTAVLEHYEHMDTDTQRLVPLRKIYWPS